MTTFPPDDEQPEEREPEASSPEAPESEGSAPEEPTPDTSSEVDPDRAEAEAIFGRSVSEESDANAAADVVAEAEAILAAASTDDSVAIEPETAEPEIAIEPTVEEPSTGEPSEA